jgi:hypothetical protein
MPSRRILLEHAAMEEIEGPATDLNWPEQRGEDVVLRIDFHGLLPHPEGGSEPLITASHRL